MWRIIRSTYNNQETKSKLRTRNHRVLCDTSPFPHLADKLNEKQIDYDYEVSIEMNWIEVLYNWVFNCLLIVWRRVKMVTWSRSKVRTSCSKGSTKRNRKITTPDIVRRYSFRSGWFYIRGWIWFLCNPRKIFVMVFNTSTVHDFTLHSLIFCHWAY